MSLMKEIKTNKWSRLLQKTLTKLEHSGLQGDLLSLVYRAAASPQDHTWFQLAIKSSLAQNKKIRIIYADNNIEHVFDIEDIIGNVVEARKISHQFILNKYGNIKRRVVDLPHKVTFSGQEIVEWLTKLNACDATFVVVDKQDKIKPIFEE